MTLGTWKKRVSSAGPELCQGHDCSHSLGSAQETFPAGPGWKHQGQAAFPCQSTKEQMPYDKPFLLLFAQNAKQVSGQSPLKPSSCAVYLFRVCFLDCSRNCTMRGHPKKGRRLCISVPHIFQASGEKTELLTGIRSIWGNSKLLLSCLMSICPPDFGGLSL